MKRLEVRTQRQLDKALRKNRPDRLANIPVLIGEGVFTVAGDHQIEALDSATVIARGNTHVDCGDDSAVIAYDNALITATGYSTVMMMSDDVHVIATDAVYVYVLCNARADSITKRDDARIIDAFKSS